jgi:hypothetical protein
LFLLACSSLAVWPARPVRAAEDPVLQVREFFPGPGGGFGFRTAAADVDRDGIKDLAVGAPNHAPEGLVWLLFLAADGATRELKVLSALEGGLQTGLHNGDDFGSGVAFLGDLDGDGGEELAAGASGDSLGGEGRGAVWILSLDGAGKVKKQVRIGAGAGGFTGGLDNGDAFGGSLAAPGDLDGDGKGDLVVHSAGDDDGGEGRGALWVLFLAADGTVKGQQKISSTVGGFDGAIEDGDGFGVGLGALGDLDGDGVEDLAVGAPGDDDGGTSRGAVWILFLRADGTVKAHQKISSTAGGLAGPLATLDRFGVAAAGLGDVDGDGTLDLAVGSRVRDSLPDEPEGAVWTLFLEPTGMVKGQGRIQESGSFGSSLAALGDFDGDGVEDFAAGKQTEFPCAGAGGAVELVFLNANGTAKAQRRTCAGDLGARANRVGAAGDIDGNGTRDLILSEPGDLWLLLLDPEEKVKERRRLFPGGTFTGDVDPDDAFGSAATGLGDLDGDGAGDIAVADPADDDGGEDFGAVWILFLKADGTVKADRKVSATQGGFAGPILENDGFATSLAGLGDVDGDGVEDLAIGARRDASGGENRGAVWILFLNADGTVKGQKKIAGGAGITLADGDLFGAGLAGLGDLDGDGVPDLAAGAPGKEVPFLANAGAVWVLFLKNDGGVKSAVEIPYAGEDVPSPRMGESLARLGDLDGDAVVDLAVGAPGVDPGVAFILILAKDGSATSSCRIHDQAMAEPTIFGASLAGIGDWNGDGSPDLAVEKDVDLDDEPNLNLVQFLFLDLDAVTIGDQVPNDCNQDGKLDIGDAICLLGHLFQGQPSELPCAGGTVDDRGNVALLDCDGNQRVDLTDAICVLAWLFQGGQEPIGGRECKETEGCPSACRT